MEETIRPRLDRPLRRDERRIEGVIYGLEPELLSSEGEYKSCCLCELVRRHTCPYQLDCIGHYYVIRTK